MGSVDSSNSHDGGLSSDPAAAEDNGEIGEESTGQTDGGPRRLNYHSSLGHENIFIGERFYYDSMLEEVEVNNWLYLLAISPTHVNFFLFSF